MNKRNFFKLNILYTVMVLFFAQNTFAANFNIEPYGTLPTKVTTGQKVPAYFTITNMTNTARNGYVVHGLPATVTQNTTSPNCANPINLGPHASCQLQLDITGAVSSNFAICNGSSCTTSAVPLNISLQSYAYVVNLSNTISICPLNSDGSFGICTTSDGSGTLDNPLSLALNTKAGLAYVTNFNSNTISICPLNNDGSFDICTTYNDSGAFNSPDMIALNSTATFAYVSSFFNNIVYICSLNIDGSFGTCFTSNGSSTFHNPNGIVLNANNSIAYVANAGSSTISICPLNNDGSFGTCTSSTGNGTFSAPKGISLNSTNTFVYVANQGSTTISICPLNIDGSLGTCITSDGNGTFDFSAEWSQNLFMLSPQNYGYIPNSNNTVSICPINNNGSLGTCNTIEGNGTFYTPVGVTITV